MMIFQSGGLIVMGDLPGEKCKDFFTEMENMMIFQSGGLIVMGDLPR